MIRTNWLTPVIAMIAMGTSTADAALLKQGELACRNEKALVQLLTARSQGDEHTMAWLFDGAVCVTVPKDTEVRILAATRAGNQQLRTVNRRRNIDLWAANRSTLKAE
jgi:hypothetical protein